MGKVFSVPDGLKFRKYSKRFGCSFFKSNRESCFSLISLGIGYRAGLCVIKSGFISNKQMFAAFGAVSKITKIPKKK